MTHNIKNVIISTNLTSLIIEGYNMKHDKLDKVNNFTGDYLDTEEAMARVSWYYYKQGMTQTAIAKKLNTNRIRIMKMLEKARDTGIVEIRIKRDYYNILEIERDLIEKFNLVDAMVIPYHRDRDLNECIGIGAAQYLSMILKANDVIGVGWGDTVSKTIRYLSLDHLGEFYIVSLTGGVLSFIYEGVFFGKYSKNIRILPAPLLVANEKVAKAIHEEPEVKTIMNMVKIANYALIGVGALNTNATIIREGYITEDEFALLRQKGAIGDILGQFFDGNGNRVRYDTDKRLIAYPIEKLREIPNVIAVAGGSHKVKAIRASLMGRYVKTLITDEKTAYELLKT